MTLSIESMRSFSVIAFLRDLIANMPEGWGVDMIENSATARDGDGRDMNPTDEGDWAWYPSTWHGTHVAGTIGAAQNEIGISGIAPNVSIQHVRVLGRCGGSLSDIADGVTWASGGTVSGVPANATPAHIINMSLGGGSSTCRCIVCVKTAERAAMEREERT